MPINHQPTPKPDAGKKLNVEFVELSDDIEWWADALLLLGYVPEYAGSMSSVPAQLACDDDASLPQPMDLRLGIWTLPAGTKSPLPLPRDIMIVEVEHKGCTCGRDKVLSFCGGLDSLSVAMLGAAAHLAHKANKK